MEEKKKCPFHTGANGELLDCCGKACMAYYEYTPMVCGETPPRIPMCSRIQMNITSVPCSPVLLSSDKGGCGYE